MNNLGKNVLTRRILSAKNYLREMWHCLKKTREEVRKKNNPDNRVVTLNPGGKPRGRGIISYIIDGFLLPPGSPISNGHTNIWQSINMAEAFVELGFAVDVISYKNHSFVPSGEYSFIVDVRHNIERLSPLLNEDCTKIMHLDTAAILFHNAAGAKRVLDLQERRGITLSQRRYERPNRGLEYADFATIIGEDFAVSTFKYAKKNLFRLPTPCGIMLDWPEREWGKCKKNFLWFSSGGLVHKGLDLALEAFAEMPDYNLIVCAPLDREMDFIEAYKKELYDTTNIQTIGWVDIDSLQFRKITSSCAAMLHLSCSECGGTAVKMGMHAGLIPIVSYESGVEASNFGFILRDCSVTNIKKIVRHVASTPQDELKQMARKAWLFARKNYTREKFAKKYREFVSQIDKDLPS